MPDLAEREPARDGSDRAVRRWGSATAWCLLAGVLSQQLPLPWALVAGAFYLGAIIVGAVTVVLLLKSRPLRPVALSLVGSGVFLAGVMTLWTLVQLAFYPAFSDYDQCRRSALTESRQATCSDELMRHFELTPTR